MKKKAYIKPELNVIMMTEQTNILAGSVTNVTFSDEEAEDDVAWSAKQGYLWNDIDE